MVYGYAGKFAVINLNTGDVKVQPLDDQLAVYYLGGRGFVSRLLYELIPESTDPLGPDNILILALGPLTGTVVPTSGRFSIGAKSPLTGTIGGGNAGGFWGPKLKWAGFDGIVIYGQASEPVYLLIEDEVIRIMPALDIWGLDTWQTTEYICNQCENSQLSVACIGIAGENKLRLANVIVDKVRAAGRGGLGAVMGSKNLKAIAVHGTGAVRLYDAEKLEHLSCELARGVLQREYSRSRMKYGAYGGFRRQADHGALMAYNGQTGISPAADNIDGDAFNQRALLGMKACFECPMPCWSTFLVPDGPYAGLYGEELTTTTLKELGARCGMTSLDAILAAHVLLDRYGLDEISAAGAIAFAMECYQRGIITRLDTEGLELHWGLDKVVLELIKQMAYNRGFGGQLGQGVRICAKSWGHDAEKYAFHVKGMEVVGTDPRGYPAWGLGYATSTRGACHMRAYSVFEYGGMTDQEMLRIAGTTSIGRRLSWESKGRAVAYLEDLRCVGDSLELCHFLTRGTFGFPEEQVGLIVAATGQEYSPDELKRVGERIYNVERLFNLREGITPAEDTLPERFLKEPLPNGPSKGYLFPLDKMLDEYYATRGWDRQSGYPTPAKRQELGL
ncbi:MAG: aldehyde ferredoxin oxidoreductase family protein [Anaerolineae bacterium]